jgi:hypothetical protein
LRANTRETLIGRIIYTRSQCVQVSTGSLCCHNLTRIISSRETSCGNSDGEVWARRPKVCCVLLKGNRRFGGTYRLHLQGRPQLATCFMLVSCLTHYSTLQMEANVPPKRPLIFNVLDADISQMVGLFITSAVRTSNPT